MKIEDLYKDKEILEYIASSDRNLCNIGFTEHNLAHVSTVAEVSSYILRTFHIDDHDIYLAMVASYLHDIGNCVSRKNHAQHGALLCKDLLLQKGFTVSDTIKVMYAIGNHDESTGIPADPISAALIIADKSDIRRSRVRKRDKSKFDIHDKVNYSAISTNLKVEKDRNAINLNISLDSRYSSSLDYFEIFLDRMLLCKSASNIFNCEFKLNLKEV